MGHVGTTLLGNQNSGHFSAAGMMSLNDFTPSQPQSLDLSVYTQEHPILVTDDQQPILDLYRAMFAVHSLTSLATSDGLEAWSVCQTTSISLVISDLRKPGLSGMELFQRLKSNPSTANIPFIIVTATPSPAIKQEFLQQGGTAFMTKPIIPSTFVRFVIDLLRTEAHS
ncbi:MAG: response regulator [Anaerolineae bacterium]|nr:response regulator [Anaerolineae bacterium]